MKKIMNSPSDFVKETIEGILLAYPDKLKISEENNRVILSKYPHKKGKVGIVTGGGSGHLPVFLGYVGDGIDRKSTRLNSSHVKRYRMPSSA